MYPVVAVLPASRRPQVGFSIVQAVMINMVHNEMVWGVYYFAVHLNILALVFTQMNPSAGIESVAFFDSMPFVLIQSLEIFRIDYGVFALSKRYPAESIAVADPAVIQRQGHERPRQPVRNRNLDGKVESNTTAPMAPEGSGEILNSKL